MIAKTPQEQAEALVGAGESLAAIRKKAGKPLAVCFKWGGHGDFMALVCLGRAVQRRVGDAQHVVLVARLGGASTDVDLVAGLNGTGMDAVLAPECSPQAMLRMLQAEAAGVYHMPGYAVKGYGTAVADAALAPYAPFYYGFPQSNQFLADLGMTQWEVMAASSGLDVTPNDLPVCRHMQSLDKDSVPITMLLDGASAVRDRARLHGVGRYVVIHNQAGGRGTTKNMPHETMQAVVDAVNARGLRVVQVGRKDEFRYRGVIDRRGLRWPLTLVLLANAQLYVGIEGALAYAAYAERMPAAIAVGPTPATVFQFPGHFALNEQACRPCWHSTADWHTRCPLGYSHCVNMPSPQQAAERVAAILAGLETGDADNRAFLRAG